MSRIYAYVGPPEIRRAVADTPAGVEIRAPADLLDWARAQPEWDADTLTATFVVTLAGVLRVAPRRSEHVACAGGHAVLAAGELTLRAEPELAVEGVTNQSTGYCPEPACWSAILPRLEALGVPHPAELTRAFVFRRCPACGERNVVKEGWFVCDLCGADLPAHWNFADLGEAH